MYSSTERPRRPAIPLSAYVLVSIVLSQRAVLRGAEPWLGSSQSRIAAVVGVTLLVCMPLALWLLRPLAVPALLLGLSTFVGIALSSLVLASGRAFVEAAKTAPVSQWELRIMSEPSLHEDKYRCRASVRLPNNVEGVVWLSVPNEVRYGDLLRCVGNFSPNQQDEWGTSSRMQGVWGNVRVVRILTQEAPDGIAGIVCGLRTHTLRHMEPNASASRALLAGGVCGYRAGLGQFGVDKRFSTCGLSHLVAVSGTHLAVVMSLLATVLELLCMRPLTRCLLLIAVSGLYVLYCGTPISAIRSWAMTCTALAASLLGRRSHALSGVAVVGIVMVLLDPSASGQLGFILSVVSVAGLCVFAPYAAYVIRTLVGNFALPRFVPGFLARRIRRATNAIEESLCASLVAQAVTLPVVMDAFGTLPLVGPLSNLLVALPFTALITLGMLACIASAVPYVGTLMLCICDVLAGFILCVVDWLCAIPFASIDASGVSAPLSWAIVAGALCLLVLWPRVSRKVIVGLCLAIVLAVSLTFTKWRLFAPAGICVLDIGQGDATLIQDGAATVLVDAGPDDSIVRALARNHVMHVDALVITHLHDDHYAGAEYVARSIGCDHLYVAEGVAESMPQELREVAKSTREGAAQEVRKGDVIRAGGFSLTMVWPTGPVDGNENEDSIELVVNYNEGGKTLRGLLTGDAEKDETDKVLEAGLVGDIDFLKVGHHGSEVSISPAQATALDPEVSVASAGKNNRYGHPTRECVETLVDAGSAFYCTKDVGDVRIYPGAEGPSVVAQQ